MAMETCNSSKTPTAYTAYYADLANTGKLWTPGGSKTQVDKALPRLCLLPLALVKFTVERHRTTGYIRAEVVRPISEPDASTTEDGYHLVRDYCMAAC